MSTIAEFRLPAADSALPVAFDRVPDARFELEPSASNGDPCLRVAGANRRTVEPALADDHTIDSFAFVLETERRLLYDVSFDGPAERLFDDLLAEGGAVLAADGSDGWWLVRMRFRERDALPRTHDRLRDRGVRADVHRIATVADPDGEAAQLTAEQREAIVTAFDRGYFEIPRGISMEELAAELGISHQALSERLRRAFETLVDAQVHAQPGEGGSGTEAETG